MGKLFASCHHEVDHHDDLVSVRYRDERYDCDGVSHVVVYAEFCKQCADDLKKTTDWLENDEAVDQFLKEGS